MPNWLYNYPTWAMVAIVVGFFVTLTWAGALFIRPLARTFIRNEPGATDIVAYLLGAHGVYFGILLGLLSVSAYGNFSATEALVADESSKMAAVYRDSSSYPDPFRTQLTDILREYTVYIIDEAWPLQQEGKIPLKGQSFLDRFQQTLIQYEPKSRAQEILHAETFRQYNDLLEARRKRVLAVTSQIPEILWFVVYIGALVNVLLVWLLDMKLKAQFFLGGVTSFYLATLIALLGAMDKPFRGEMSVSSDPYQVIYDDFMKKPLGKGVVPTGATSKTEEAAAPGATKAGGATSTEAELKALGEKMKKADAAAKKAVEAANPDANAPKAEEIAKPESEEKGSQATPPRPPEPAEKPAPDAPKAAAPDAAPKDRGVDVADPRPDRADPEP